MSKECLTYIQAKAKLGWSGALAIDDNELVNCIQCKAMGARTDFLEKYPTDMECPADDDVIAGDVNYISGRLTLAKGLVTTTSDQSVSLIGCYATMSGGRPFEMRLGSFTITEEMGLAKGYIMCGIYIVNDDHRPDYGNIYLRVYKGGGWPFGNRVRIDIGSDPKGVYWFSKVFEFTDTTISIDIGSNLIKPIGFSYMELLQFFEQLIRANYNAPYKFVFYKE